MDNNFYNSSNIYIKENLKGVYDSVDFINIKPFIDKKYINILPEKGSTSFDIAKYKTILATIPTFNKLYLNYLNLNELTDSDNLGIYPTSNIVFELTDELEENNINALSYSEDPYYDFISLYDYNKNENNADEIIEEVKIIDNGGSVGGSGGAV